MSLSSIHAEIASLEARLEHLRAEAASLGSSASSSSSSLPRMAETGLPMELEEYRRYGRQMILPGMGLPGQLKLRNASVLVIGAGGLGCPALQYLAGAGIGHIGIVDHDTVELSNLHRQILHTEARVGWLKVDSAKAAMLSMNHHLDITTHPIALSSSTALSLISSYDFILDCTDTPLTRYLISDACVLANKPLVSGAALGFNGQLAVYNNGQESPCYRCVWPRVARGKARAGTCEEEGVVGGVTGVIGTLMALEAVKMISGLTDPSTPPTLLIYSALSSPLFRSIKLRKRQPKCRACGDPDSSNESGTSKIIDLTTEDYITFCGAEHVDWTEEGMRKGVERVGVTDLEASILSDPEITVIDTRTPEAFSIASIPNSTNIPLQTLLSDPLSHLPSAIQSSMSSPLYVVCRRGNDSQEAAEAIRDALISSPTTFEGEVAKIFDVKGGVVAWGREIGGGEKGGWPTY